jgi:hypothetical protein
VLIALLSACSPLERAPDPPIATDDVVIQGAQEPPGVEDPLASFLHWLSNAPPGAAAPPDGIGWGDGFIPDGDSLSPFETAHPAIAHLDSALLEAIQGAASDALQDGIELRVSSGWRSAGYQEVLLDEAIDSYGSEETARRFVNTPEQSTHVQGAAVDVSPTDAMSWLSQQGFAYGLCRTYANEPWHYELMIEPGGVCPRPLIDASVTHEQPGTSPALDRGLERERARP